MARKITKDADHYAKWFHLCRLRVYCIFYQNSLRHPGDGRK